MRDEVTAASTLNNTALAASAAAAQQSEDESTMSGVSSRDDNSDINSTERRRLQDKLRELQAKKDSMEQLLGELNGLREYRHSQSKCEYLFFLLSRN